MGVPMHPPIILCEWYYFVQGTLRNHTSDVTKKKLGLTTNFRHFYTPVWKTDVLCRGNVRPSVCPSFRLSVHVFRTFLQHALRYQFETWYIHSVGGRTCRVWVASQLGHFDLVYSQKKVKPIFCNHGLINQDKFFKFVTHVACCILLNISSFVCKNIIFRILVLFLDFGFCVLDFSKFSRLFFYMFCDISLKLGICMQ